VKILVFAHRLDLGGTQVNAIDLAATVRDRFGHDMVLFASPGPAAALAEGRGLRVVAAPDVEVRPSTATMAALRRVVASERVDLVHAWDWPQVLDAALALALPGSVPVLGTSMSMTLERFLPRSVPMTFGTTELAARAARVWRAPVALLEPPVDTGANHPGAVDPGGFRRRHGLDDGVPTVVVVSRLARTLKLEGIRRAVDAVASLAAARAARLVVVGDGDAAGELWARAGEVNRRLGWDAVVLTGAMADPREAYAAADIVLGMGGSALRALAFAKPLVVLGEQGFSEVLSPATVDGFLWSGFYGTGDGDVGPTRLCCQLRALLDQPSRLAALGGFGLDLVRDRFALGASAARLEAVYREVAGGPAARGSARVCDAARSLAVRCGAGLVPAPVRRRVSAAGTA
jgi:glycosyltransferase involved in cell wall biosynthesis